MIYSIYRLPTRKVIQLQKTPFAYYSINSLTHVRLQKKSHKCSYREDRYITLHAPLPPQKGRGGKEDYKFIQSCPSLLRLDS